VTNWYNLVVVDDDDDGYWWGVDGHPRKPKREFLSNGQRSKSAPLQLHHAQSADLESQPLAYTFGIHIFGGRNQVADLTNNTHTINVPSP
jgi:hypothetical protein